MPVHNAEIAAIFNEVADLLDIEEANPFRVRAYRTAADTIGRLPRPLADWLREGKDLADLHGIGKDLAAKIEEIVQTGRLGLLEALRCETPAGLTALLKIPGLGPRRVHALHEALGIRTTAELERALRAGRVQQLPGFGRKIEQNLLEQLARLGKAGEAERILLVAAEQIVAPLVDYVRACEGVGPVDVAGSFRRRKETVGDLDVLAVSRRPDAAMKNFVRYEDVRAVRSKGPTRATVVLRSDLQVDLRVIPAQSYGAALCYFTGSKAHNIAMRKLAQERGFKINEYGVFAGKKRVAGRTEEDVYAAFDLPYIVPELREDRGELEAARQGRLPCLVTLGDMRGDLQSHTKASDGENTLEEMALTAREKGYEYLAITDHSPLVAIAHGLDEKRLVHQVKVIDRLNAKLDGFQVLKGIEVDILEDGLLDLPDDVLKELDLRVCAIHSRFNLSREKQTERILRAMDQPCFNILAHPTGRLLGKRPPYEVDLERIMEAARERGCFLEVNAQPDRLDLDDACCKLAKEMGLQLAISTDAHRVLDLDYMRFGVDQARRGWLGAADVLNTKSLDGLKRLLKRT